VAICADPRNTPRRTWARLVASLVALLAAECAGAADPALLDQLEARVAALQKDSSARAKAIAQGRDHAVLCAYCHGPDGNSAKPEIPNLAAQNPAYLLEQIERFADGRREDYTRVMQRLSANLSAEERVALVVYYAAAPLTPARADIGEAQTGMPIYQRLCAGCHGRDGNGVAGYARLAGQQPHYLAQTLKTFRDRRGGRLSPEMDSVTRGLADAEIFALAAYLANLR
jgi:cytochrome c553